MGTYKGKFGYLGSEYNFTFTNLSWPSNVGSHLSPIKVQQVSRLLFCLPVYPSPAYGHESRRSRL